MAYHRTEYIGDRSMNSNKEAARLLEALANGVDPSTGEVLPREGWVSDPTVLAALKLGASALSRLRDVKEGQEKAGGKWTEEEDDRLLKAYRNDTPVDEIARKHRRTELAILSRLEKLGAVVLNNFVVPKALP